MSAVKKLIFSAAASLLFLLFVVPLLGRMNVVESVGGTATVIVVAVFSVSASGLIAEACSWIISERKGPLWRTVTNASKITSPEQPAPVAATSPEPNQATPAATSGENDLVARIEALETRLKEMNKPEQQAVAPPPAVVTAGPKVATPSPNQQQQQKKNHVEVLLGGAS